jgi:SAM-dependent methyltransferase
MFRKLEYINTRPKPFEFYTASDLWTDEHTSEQMLAYHLNPDVDLSSRNAEFINRSVDWIVSRFATGPGTKIADFGCGPGLYATKLAQRGVEVTGIDFSKRSIEYARKMATEENLDIHYVNQNYFEFETEDRFDLVMMIMCDFCALSPGQRKQILEKFHKVLKPDGSILLDVHSLAAFANRHEAATYEKNLLDGFWAPNPYYGFLNTFKYDDDKVTLDKYTIVEESRTRTVYNWLQHFSPAMIEKEFGECGLTIETLYSDVAGSAFDPKGTELAIVATKT